MSNWTHVAAIIRVDGLPFFGKYKDWDKIFGKECLWKSDSSVWEDMRKHPEDYLPHGSEGSLRKSVWVNPDESSMAAYTISIFGDLRHHDNIDEIIDWFNKSCDKCFIRQACITVTNEWYGTKTIEYDKSRKENVYNNTEDDEE